MRCEVDDVVQSLETPTARIIDWWNCYSNLKREGKSASYRDTADAEIFGAGGLRLFVVGSESYVGLSRGCLDVVAVGAVSEIVAMGRATGQVSRRKKAGCFGSVCNKSREILL
jgi:hypothetical protein